MSSTSIISSGESEQRWATVMEKHFDQGHVVGMPFCVFRVPKSISDEKPEAYAPTRLGLGPLHHLRPDLHAMNTHKLAAIAKLLPPEKLHSFREAVVEALVGMEAVVRGCYDQYLDLDIKTLAWILAVDGLYLLHFLGNYPFEMEHVAVEIAGDILMLENQIPLLLLNKILDLLQLSPADDRLLLRSFQTFFERHSPLELESGTESANYDHLLHRIYFLIMNRVPRRVSEMARRRSRDNDVTKALKFLAERGLPGAGAAVQIMSFTSGIPWDKISGLLKKDSPASSAADEIDIPSASQMTEIAGIRFSPAFAIRDIAFSESDKEFRLPLIKINSTTETVLRNLVAYEAAAAAAAPGATAFPMADYVDLMCGIIDTPKDVDILRKSGIVQSQMTDEDIARIFNGITKSEKKRKKKTDEVSNVEKAAGDLNTRYGSLPLVKFMKSAEKYGYGCLKVMSTVVTIVVVVLLTLQAYCSVFGCGRWFGNDDNDVVAAL